MRTFNLQSGTPACNYNAQSQRAITPHNHTVMFRRERTTTMTPAVPSSAAMTTMKAMPAPPVSGSCAMLCTFSTVSEIAALAVHGSRGDQTIWVGRFPDHRLTACRQPPVVCPRLGEHTLRLTGWPSHDMGGRGIGNAGLLHRLPLL